MAQKRTDDTFLLTFVLVLLPLISAVSAYYGNRSLLLVIYLVLAMVFFIVIARRNNEGTGNKDRILLLLVVSISLSLLLSQSLGSANLIGADIHEEYGMFSQVAKDGVWQPDLAAPYNSALSVTILPAALNAVTDLDGITIFKIVFPALFSLVPALLYLLYRKILSAESSALAAFVSITSSYFYGYLIGIARQEVAEVLLMLLMLVLLSSKIHSGRSHAPPILILLLTIGLLTAHYSTLYIYVATLLLSSLLGYLFKRTFSELINPWMLAFLVSASAAWYLFVANGFNLTQLVDFFRSTLGINSADFFELSTRPTIVSEAMGIGVSSGVLHYLNYAVNLLLNFALLIGFFVFLFKGKQRDEAERKMFPFMMGGMILIGASVILPHFSFGFTFSRFYQVALLFVAPCFVFGMNFVAAKIAQLSAIIRHGSVRAPTPSHAKILAAVILVLYLLCSSGWVWAASMDRPTSSLFDHERMLTSHDSDLEEEALTEYTSPRDISAVLWLRPQLAGGFPLCSDFWTQNNVLRSYGGILSGSHSIPTEGLNVCNFRRAYVFLSVLNAVYGVITISTETNSNSTLPTTEISSQLYPLNNVYSDGGARIYLYPGSY